MSGPTSMVPTAIPYSFQQAFNTSLSPAVATGRDASFFDRSKAYTPHTAITDNSFQHFTDTFWRTKQPEILLSFFHAGLMGPEQVNFLTSRVLPFRETTTEEFKFITWTYDFTLMEIVPPGALPSQQISHMEEYSVRLDRWGQQFQMFDEELTTELGKQHFIENSVQMGINRLSTIKLVAITALTSPEIIDNSDSFSYGRMDSENLDSSLRKRAQAFCPLSRESTHVVQSIFSLIQIGMNTIAQLTGLKPDTYILPPSSDIILQQTKPEQTFFFEYEGFDPTPKVILGLNTPLMLPNGISTFIMDLPRVSNRQQNTENLDILKEHTIIGEFYLMHSNYVNLCQDPKCFEPDIKDIEVFDLARNDWIRVIFRDAILKAGVFTVNQDGQYDWYPKMYNHTEESMFHRQVLDGVSLVEYVLQMGNLEGENGAKRTAQHLLSKFLAENVSIYKSYDSVISDAKALIRNIANQVPTIPNYIGVDDPTRTAVDPADTTKTVPSPLLHVFNVEELDVPVFEKSGVTNIRIASHDLNGAMVLNDAVFPNNMQYPAGMTNYSSLKSLSEYNGTKENLKSVSGKIRPFIELIENLTSFLQTHLPDSELLNKDNIQPWIDSDLIGNVLIESFIGRLEPILFNSGAAVGAADDTFMGRLLTKDFVDLINDTTGLEVFLKNQIAKNDDYPVYKVLLVLNEAKVGAEKFVDDYNNAGEKEKKTMENKLYQAALKRKESLPQPSRRASAKAPQGTYIATSLDATPGMVEYLSKDTSGTLFVGKHGSHGTAAVDVTDKDARNEFMTNAKKSILFIKSQMNALERHSSLSFLTPKVDSESPMHEERRVSIGRAFSFRDDFSDDAPKKKIGVSLGDSRKKMMETHFIGDAVSNIRVMDTLGSPLMMIIYHAFLTSKNIPRTMMNLIEHKVYVPLNVLLTRPQIRLETSASVLCVSNMGNTYYIQGQQYNGPSSTGMRAYTVYLKFGCVIRNPKAAFYIPNTKMTHYLAGLSTQYFEVGDGSALMDQIERKEHADVSLIPLIVPATYRPESEILYLAKIETLDTKTTKIPMIEYYDGLWQFTTNTYGLAELRRLSKGAYYSLFKGTHFRWNPATQLFDVKIKGTGHLSEMCYVGCRGAFDGTQLFKKPQEQSVR